MAEIVFTPLAVSVTAARVVLTDAGKAVLTLKLPSRACAKLVHAVLANDLRAA